MIRSIIARFGKKGGTSKGANSGGGNDGFSTNLKMVLCVRQDLGMTSNEVLT